MATNSQIAFNPQGETVVIAAASTAPTGVQVPSTGVFSQQESGIVRIVNVGNDTVHIGVGKTAAAAQAAAVAATAGSPAAGIPMVPGAVEILRFGPNDYISGYAANAATVYVTPGMGL
jgi:hypothetical protein